MRKGSFAPFSSACPVFLIFQSRYDRFMMRQHRVQKAFMVEGVFRNTRGVSFWRKGGRIEEERGEGKLAGGRCEEDRKSEPLKSWSAAQESRSLP